MTAILLMAMAAGQFGVSGATASGGSILFVGPGEGRAWKQSSNPVVSGSLDGATAACERSGLMVFTGGENGEQGSAGFSGKLMAMWQEGRYMWSVNNGGRSGRLSVFPRVGDSLQIEVTPTAVIFTVNGSSFTAPGAFDTTSEQYVGAEATRANVLPPGPFATVRVD